MTYDFQRDDYFLRNAQQELKFAGFYSNGSDYGNDRIAETVMEMLTVFKHRKPKISSHQQIFDILDKLLNKIALSPLTNDPKEWDDFSEYSGSDEHPCVWSSRRDDRWMSYDKGNTYFDKHDRSIIYTSKTS